MLMTADLIDLTVITNPLTLVPTEPPEVRPGAYEIVEHVSNGRWVASALAGDPYPSPGQAYEALLTLQDIGAGQLGLVLGIRDLSTGEVIIV